LYKAERTATRGHHDDVSILGGRGPSLAGAEVVDVAHAPLLQGHRRAAGGDADHPGEPPPSSAPGVAGDEVGEVPGDAVLVAERRRGAEEGLRLAAAGGGIRGHGCW
jgi:hypothetical protein